MLSTQLQFSSKPALPNYAGKALDEQLNSFIYSKHTANRPFKAPQFYNYKSAYFENSLSGYRSFYRGAWSGALAFYCSVLAKSALVKLVPEDFSSKFLAGKLQTEVVTSCAAELMVQPLFVAQSRMMLQSSAKNMQTYRGLIDIYARCPKEIMQGWSCALVRGGVLGWGHYSSPLIEKTLNDLLGELVKHDMVTMVTEALSYALGYWAVYPILTIQRRLAVQSASVRMLPYTYRGLAHGLWTAVTKEGVASLYRGFSIYSIAVRARKTLTWLMSMPVLTQTFWETVEAAYDTDVRKSLDLD